MNPPLPLDIGRIHFTGIGGIGMSGIAEILHDMGYQVQGSDTRRGANTARLESKGIPVAIGQRAENITDAALIVISTAIGADNPECIEARRRGLPVVHRAEMLGELMRLRYSVAIAGTHGKTTTTSLVATLLDAAGMEPTVINGGIMGGWGSNARLGNGAWIVAEADESDGSFARLDPTVAVVTNIDAEHLDHYGSIKNLEAAFRRFITSIPFYGFAVLCLDHPVLRRMAGEIKERRVIAYGIEAADADLRAVDIRAGCDGMHFAIELSARVDAHGIGRIEGMHLPMLGQHNVLNCLGALAVPLGLGARDDAATMRAGIASAARALGRFEGVGRRFEAKGSAGGIMVIDDYGHHPAEIKAALAAARMLLQNRDDTGGNGGGDSSRNRVIAVVQPHRFTRLRDLFDDFCTCFADADHVLVADVYAAGEKPIAGVDRDALVAGITRAGHGGAMALESPDALAGAVLEIAAGGDVVICLGAGDSTAWAAALPRRMQSLLAERRQA